MDETLSLATLGALLGGLGLFLLAVQMISEGLRLAAGEALKDLLGRWTRTPLHGIGSGALITGIVQSSSAVTVATIGFVNANLLTMHQALGVVYGANIGTTMTGWLVAAVGFKIKVELFALPLIGIGMALRLSDSRGRRGAIGEALAGFGLFFIGVDVLRGAFEGLAQSVDLAAIDAGSALGMLLFVGLGFFMTLVTQSSSAAIAITLTAATGGVVGLPAAAAAVIGANIGTTSTALFAAIGATANARRVVAAHIVFNLVTGVVALLILPLMLWLVALTSELLDLESSPAVALAIFHTLFNVLGVLLLWPVTGRLADLLSRRFTTEAETLGRPRYLDATTSGTPSLALEAMRLELARVLELARETAGLALQAEVDRARLENRHRAVGSLLERVDAAVAAVERQRLGPELAQGLSAVLRITHQTRNAMDAALRLARLPADDKLTAEFHTAVVRQLEQAAAAPELTPAIDLRALEHQARDNLLAAAVAQRMSVATTHPRLERLRETRHMLEQLGDAGQQLRSLSDRLPLLSQDA